MQSNSLVSIIVPCYNYAHFLSEALESVLAQTYANWECIVINDGSPDNTEEVALKYCTKDSRFKYFYKENGGHSSARNYGISQSSGKYILPLDADDRISENYVEAAVEKMETNANIRLVTGQVRHFGDLNETVRMPEFKLRALLLTNFLCNGSLFRRRDYDNTNGYDETMLGFEDWDFWIGLLRDGGLVVELPFVCYYYRKKDDSMFQAVRKDRKQIFKDQLKLYNNNIEAYEKYFDNPIHLIQENEKSSRVIHAYQNTVTYKVGLRIHKIKKWLGKK